MKSLVNLDRDETGMIVAECPVIPGCVSQSLPRWFSTIVLALLINGCVSDQAHRYYGADRFPAKPIEQVEVLYDIPTRPHDIIADFQARGASVKYMRKKAAEIGADAVIVGCYGGYRAKGDEWASKDTYAKSYSRITGTALVYRR
jgi:hypothetical protein